MRRTPLQIMSLMGVFILVAYGFPYAKKAAGLMIFLEDLWRIDMMVSTIMGVWVGWRMVTWHLRWSIKKEWPNIAIQPVIIAGLVIATIQLYKFRAKEILLYAIISLAIYVIVACATVGVKHLTRKW